MLTRNDCLLLITDIELDNSIDKEELENIKRQIIHSNSISIDVLKFVNRYRPLEVSKFYEQLRRNYNHKKSKLYKNIVSEIEDTQNVLTTLSSLLTQILLFANKCEERELFLKHSRAKEITYVLSKYFEDADITICLKLMRLIKADLKCLEELEKPNK